MNNQLTELLPRKVRLWLYLFVCVITIVIDAWMLAEGNWLLFAASIVTTFQSALAAANVTPEQVAPPTPPTLPELPTQYGYNE